MRDGNVFWSPFYYNYIAQGLSVHYCAATAQVYDLVIGGHNQSQLTLCYVSACTVIKLAKLHTAIGSGFSAEPIAELIVPLTFTYNLD